MTPERRQQVMEVFDAVIALDPAERSSRLDEACASDPELRHEVDTLLLSHEQAGTNFLKAPLADLSTDGSGAVSPVARLGHRIGVYQVVAEIGHGGMGEVYRAVRADGQYEKQVAIKMVRVGYDSSYVIERFRTERQILASLDRYKKSLAGFKLLASDPKDMDSRANIAATQAKIAFIVARIGQTETAAELYRNSLELAEPLAAANPPNERARYTVGGCVSWAGRDIGGAGIKTEPAPAEATSTNGRSSKLVSTSLGCHATDQQPQHHQPEWL